MLKDNPKKPTPEIIKKVAEAFASCPESGKQFVLGFMEGQMAERARWEKENSKKPA